MPQVVVEMESKDYSAFKVWKDLISVAEKFENVAKSVTRTTREAAAENKNLEASARRVFESTRSPQEQYNKRLEHLSRLLEKNKIDQDTYNRSVFQATQDLKRLDGTYERLAEAARKAAAEEKSRNDQMAIAARKVAEQDKVLSDSAKRVYEATRTPQERHKKYLENLNSLVQSGKIDQDTYQRAAKQSADEAERQAKAHHDGSSWAKSQLSSIVGMATAYLSVESAIQAVIAAIKHKEELERRASESAITLGEAQNIVAAEMPGNTTADDRKKFYGEMKRIANKTGAKGGEPAITAQAAELFKSSTNPELVAAATEAGATMFPGMPEYGKKIADAALDLGEATGSKDMKSLVGFIKTAAEQGKPSLANTSDSLSRVWKNAKYYGATAQESTALFAALSQATEDSTGETSSKATISLMEQVASLMPEKNVIENGKLKTRGTGAKTFAERINILRNNPRKMEEVLSQVSGKATTIGALRSFISGKGEAAEQYDVASKALSKPIGDYAAVADAFTNQDKTSAQISEETKRITETAAVRNQINDLEKQKNAIYSRDILNQQLDSAGVGTMDKFVHNANYIASSSNKVGFEDAIKWQISLNEGQLPDYRTATPETISLAREQKKLLENLNAQFEKLNKQQEEQRKQLEELNRTAKRPTSAAVQNNAKGN